MTTANRGHNNNRRKRKAREWWAYDVGLSESGKVLMGFTVRNNPYTGIVERIRVREVLPPKRGRAKKGRKA